MSKIAGLVTQCVLESPLKQWLERQCNNAGNNIDWYDVTRSTAEYKKRFEDADAVMTWNCRMPHWWLQSRKKPVLHLDNSLINQRAGVFVDSYGYFSHSHLCRDRLWQASSEIDLVKIAEKEFGWKAFSNGNPDGPILVAMQCENDCNIQFEFPLAKHTQHKNQLFIDLLKDNLPSEASVLIRPHPRERAKFTMEELPSNWTLNMEGEFKHVLPTCSALVTVNSTCASEAVLLGIPTAVLGTGVFTGSGVMLECHLEPQQVAQIRSFKTLQAQQYCGALRTRSFIPYWPEDSYNNPEFRLWLECINDRKLSS
ncbi:hypothetical protein [Prosthecobacter sp.]|uniref:capsular polysaccharide export protein, LipB/KpsS family n=1 Tax=Prosthecobacter sp. TaxID=1965333 RepID=UPI0024881EE8|nr:hypothetical protein [Prosthecobacter sp.]MDI1314808.1 hypothetical protein [Prosthecobacter sp.]